MKHLVDLRNELPQCGDQGTRRSCLAFAASSAHAQRRNHAQLSIEYLHFHAISRSAGADPNGGAGMDAIAGALAVDGQPDEASWPYQGTQMMPPQWAPPKIAGTVYRADVDLNNLDLQGIAGQLDQGRSVILGIVVTNAFYRADKAGMLPVLQPDKERVGHAVLAVGHGEDADGNRYVLIRNSWGVGWGLDGHAWLSEAYLQQQLRETAVVDPQ
jgi:C1A family cysteine protease